MSQQDPHYQAREAILLQGIARQGRFVPAYAALNENEGYILRAVGRPKAALPYFQRAQAIDRLSPPKNVSLILAYAESGHEPLADGLLAQSLSRWPDHGGLRAMRLYVATFYGPPAAALAVLDDLTARPAELSASTVGAWRAYLVARQAHAAVLPADAVRLIIGADDAGELGPDMAVAMLASLGRVDEAFAQADRQVAGGRFDPGVLFIAPTAALRSDPRFGDFAKRLRLVDYWRATGNWPDFCAEPRLADACKAAARPAAKLRS